MTKIVTQTYTTVHNNSIFIMRILLTACILTAAWYGINIYGAISRTITAERISATADALGNSIGSLDAQYLELSDSASPAALSAYGMTSGTVSAYIPREPSLGSVALSGHEF